MHLLEYHTQFTDHLQAQGRARATILAYGKDIEQLLEFLVQENVADIRAITTDHIDAFKASLKKLRYTPKSISRKINSIKTFFRFLKAQGEVDDNPAEAVIHPKYQQNEPRILTRLEYRALRDVAKEDVRMAAIVELLLQTGMRISELENLTILDVDFDQNVIHITAQNNQPAREVPLNNAARKSLEKYLQVRPKTTRQDTFFLTKTCRPFLVRNIRSAIDRYFRIAGIKDAKVNDLRHTFIVEQLKAGTPLIYVSKLVGHKRVTTTERYMTYLQNSDTDPAVTIEEL